MYPYTKELTLDDAQLLPESITVYSPITQQEPIDTLTVFNLTYIYSNDNALYCTALDYATHILKQAAPPEGWGYAAYELSSGRYEGLKYGMLSDKWDIEFLPHIPFDSTASFADWNTVCFRLSHLVRVEATSEILLL
jgi:hypothetical protein